MTNHDDTQIAVANSPKESFVRTFRWHADRILARLIAGVPGVLAAAVIERPAGVVIAARARTGDDNGAPSAAHEGPREVAREVLGLVEWARAYARAESTAHCEALSLRGRATWAAQARGSSGRFMVAVVADRAAKVSAILERARMALMAVERVAV